MLKFFVFKAAHKRKLLYKTLHDWADSHTETRKGSCKSFCRLVRSATALVAKLANPY